jgi:hypothetical protein
LLGIQSNSCYEMRQRYYEVGDQSHRSCPAKYYNAQASAVSLRSNARPAKAGRRTAKSGWGKRGGVVGRPPWSASAAPLHRPPLRPRKPRAVDSADSAKAVALRRPAQFVAHDCKDRPAHVLCGELLLAVAETPPEFAHALARCRHSFFGPRSFPQICTGGTRTSSRITRQPQQ